MLQVLRLLPRTLIKSSTSLVSFRFFTAALFSFTLTQHLQANSIPVSLYSNSLNSSSIHNMSATKSKSSKLIDTAHIQPPKVTINILLYGSMALGIPQMALQIYLQNMHLLIHVLFYQMLPYVQLQ